MQRLVFGIIGFGPPVFLIGIAFSLQAAGPMSDAPRALLFLTFACIWAAIAALYWEEASTLLSKESRIVLTVIVIAVVICFHWYFAVWIADKSWAAASDKISDIGQMTFVPYQFHPKTAPVIPTAARKQPATKLAMNPKDSSQPNDPTPKIASPKIRVDPIHREPRTDGTRLSSYHIWSDQPLTKPVFFMFCDRKIESFTMACGCGFATGGEVQQTLPVRVRGEILSPDFYRVYRVMQPNPVETDYFMEIDINTNGPDNPKCEVYLVGNDGKQLLGNQ
jgi:hypothetical protein